MLDIKKTLAKMLDAIHSIGTITTAYATSSISISANAAEAVCSKTLPAGVWVVSCYVRWGGTNGGYRRANLSTTSAATDVQCQLHSSQSSTLQMQFTNIVTSSGETYYLNVYSNTATTVASGVSSGYVTGFRAVRIA